MELNQARFNKKQWKALQTVFANTLLPAFAPVILLAQSKTLPLHAQIVEMTRLQQLAELSCKEWDELIDKINSECLQTVKKA